LQFLKNRETPLKRQIGHTVLIVIDRGIVPKRIDSGKGLNIFSKGRGEFAIKIKYKNFPFFFLDLPDQKIVFLINEKMSWRGNPCKDLQKSKFDDFHDQKQRYFPLNPRRFPERSSSHFHFLLIQI